MVPIAELSIAEAIGLKGPALCRNCGYAATLEDYLREYPLDFKALRGEKEDGTTNDAGSPE